MNNLDKLNLYDDLNALEDFYGVEISVVLNKPVQPVDILELLRFN